MTESVAVIVKELSDNELRTKNLSTLSATLQQSHVVGVEPTSSLDVVGDNIASFSQLTTIKPPYERYDDESTNKNIYGSKQNIILFKDDNITSQGSDSGIVGAGAFNPLAIQTGVTGKLCRFPKLEECAHFHYERVQLGALSVCLVNDKLEIFNTSLTTQASSVIGGGGETAACSSNANNLGSISLNSYNTSNTWFLIKVSSQQTEPFLIKRSLDNMKMLDEMLHRCVYDRKISGLKNFKNYEFSSDADMEYAVFTYLERFSKIASDSVTCGTILTWLQLDNKGRRLPLADDDTMRSINTPAVGAAYGVRRYQAQACDEISIELGDMISVIDMPTPAESVWWRGKKSNWQKSHYEVGFFPQSCVATIGDKVPRYIPLPAPLVGQVDVSPTKPVLRKHGKLIAFFRSFILSRPSRRRLKQSGIYRERVFSCDLSEHLLNSGQEIPLVLKSCAEFIEAHGIVDGIYRLSGITSNIQKLRQAFDEERVPDLGNPEMRQDIHAVSSLLKMYFRELPNPLCTYQLYDNFVEAIQSKTNGKERLRLMKETVIKLPPPHYRTLRYLAKHLHRISQFSQRTGMTDKNLAIVWAPNLLRSPTLEAGGVAALQGVGVQAVVTEYLIRHSQKIFNDLDKPSTSGSTGGQGANCSSTIKSNVDLAGSVVSEMRLDSLTDCESLLIKQREFDQSTVMQDRPKSMSACGPKLISLEEAQERQLRLESGTDLRTAIPLSIGSNIAGSYIEVGGGPASLPDKYHTVLSVPRSWQKRKTHSWKSLFMRNQRVVVVGNNSGERNLDTHVVNNITCSENALTAAPKQVEGISLREPHTRTNVKLCKEKKNKSTEFLETIKSSADLAYNKGSDLCLRSSSIDSLRTAGHSRSVSHDSYFDLLQSPLHGNMATASPSRELTELGINFDREEPEMRIFSESESLVSSPRVGKENLPPNYLYFNSRRIVRARPEEFISQANSINPSPKKQPRLNMLLSPKVTINEKEVKFMPDNLLLGQELSYSKRYKFEDQFPDIQYIDCNTPEHTINANNNNDNKVDTKSSSSSKNCYKSEMATYGPLNNAVPNIIQQQQSSSSSSSSNINCTHKRYSCPSLQLLDVKRHEEDNNNHELNKKSTCKERASYPITLTRPIDKTFDQFRVVDDHKPPNQGVKAKPNKLPSSTRYSYCGTNDDNNFSFLRSKSSESSKAFNSHGMETTTLGTSKISMTPSSTAHSPRYTLLMGGDTSSENSSAITTPQYDGEIILTTPLLSMEQKTPSPTLIMPLLPIAAHPSLLVPPVMSANKNALKKELSLDLTTVFNKVPDHHNIVNDKQNHKQQQHQQQRLLQVTLSPNNSILTDNTSASVTPSDFDYQSLQRQTSVNSSLDILDYYEGENNNNNHNKESPLSTCCLISPMQKSTISITYNLRSQLKSHNDNDNDNNDNSDNNNDVDGNDDDDTYTKTKNTTSENYDDNMVYEQLKIFRNSVSELNDIFNDNSTLSHDNDNSMPLIAINEVSGQKLDRKSSKSCNKSHGDIKGNRSSSNRYSEIYDVENQQMNDDDDYDDNDDVNDKMLYENVQLRKPNNVYANVVISTTKTNQQLDVSPKNIEEDGGKSSEKCDKEKLKKDKNKNKPHNFSVKELANKFENSKSEQNLPNMGNSNIYASKKTTTKPLSTATDDNDEADDDIGNDHDVIAPAAAVNTKIVKSLQLKKTLQNIKPITRSLDEDDFEREFCAKHRQAGGLSSSSVMELPEKIMELSCQRRKSFDFTRHKALNPPKRLPGLLITTRPSFDHKFDEMLVEHTENTCGYNSINSDVSVELTGGTSDANLSPTDISNPRLWAGVKLDRERIDRIKEERRQQLTEKYGLKSRSKTELNANVFNNNEILPTRSKSRGDINQIEDHNMHDFLSSPDICNRASQNRKSLALKPNIEILDSSEKDINTAVLMKVKSNDILQGKRMKRLDLESDNNNSSTLEMNNAGIKDNRPRTRNFVLNNDMNT